MRGEMTWRYGEVEVGGIHQAREPRIYRNIDKAGDRPGAVIF